MSGYQLITMPDVINPDGECLVCGLPERVVACAVGVPVGEVVACPACTRVGARWLCEEVAYRWRPTGGDAA